MTVYYQSFSTAIDKLSEEEAQFWQNLIDADEEADEPLFECLEIKTDAIDKKMYLWFHGDDGLSDVVLSSIQEFLERFRPDSCFYCEVAQTCSNPRINSFGGYAVFVTKDRIQDYSTSDWLDKKIREFNGY
jgi:hypothetical protein